MHEHVYVLCVCIVNHGHGYWVAIQQLLWWFFGGGGFWITVFFHFVINSDLLFSCKHRFTLIASLSWVELNFFNQYQRMPSWPSVFHFGTSFIDALSESMHTFVLEPSSSPSNFFFHLVYSFGFSVMFSSFPYFAPKR